MAVMAIILVLYSVLVIILLIGWNRSLKTAKPVAAVDEAFISVVVPVRNEQQNIAKLVDNFLHIAYTNFEIIIVDDHSTDETQNFLSTLRQPQITVCTNPGEGKKNAIAEGIRRASGEIIATTDADCSLPPDWLNAINNYFADNQRVFLFGPVRLRQTGSFFTAMQAIEFASLIGSAAATAALGKPTLCNGANLAYRKQVFEEVGGFDGNVHIPSGDDEFLMRKILKKYPSGAAFIATQAAIVESLPQPDYLSFFQQRVRWASKWRYNSSGFSVGLAVFIWLSQCASLICLASLFMSASSVYFAAWLMKAFIEYTFLTRVSRFLTLRWNWLAFIVLQVVYPLYVTSIGIVSHFIPYRWKDRTVIPRRSSVEKAKDG